MNKKILKLVKNLLIKGSGVQKKNAKKTKNGKGIRMAGEKSRGRGIRMAGERSRGRGIRDQIATF